MLVLFVAAQAFLVLPRKGGGGGIGAHNQTCYSLAKPPICRCSDKAQSKGKSKGTGSGKCIPGCTKPKDDRADAKNASRFCGEALPRKNPCWRFNGTVSCLPYFFIIGEMKCGTTTLATRIAQHPRVRAPRNKEVRFLYTPKFPSKTGTWYANNFRSTVSAPDDVITFDASPTTFSDPNLAIPWVSKWLPKAKFLLMLRDPVERTYSHYQMGMNWLKASRCFTGETGKRRPIAMIRPLMQHVQNFDWQAHQRRSLQSYPSPSQLIPHHPTQPHPGPFYPT